MPKQISRAGLGTAVVTDGVTDDVWLSRADALAYLSERLGRPVGVTTLVYSWAVAYHRDGRSAVYRKSTLDAFIKDRRQQVTQQVFGQQPRRAA